MERKENKKKERKEVKHILILTAVILYKISGNTDPQLKFLI
jgi:hypothetical protein